MKIAINTGGGTPSTFDRLISLRFGAAVIRAVEKKIFNNLIVLRENRIIGIPIADVANKIKTVPLDNEPIKTAQDIGVCLGN